MQAPNDDSESLAQHDSAITLSPSAGTSTQELQTSQPVTRCSYDNSVSSLGIGLIVASKKFTLYNDASMKDTFLTIDVYADAEKLDGVCAKFHKPDYGIMHFVCTDTLDNAYKVLTDYSTVKYLRREKENGLTSWEDYILNGFGIRRITPDPKHALRTEPDASAPTVRIPDGFEMLCPIQVKGDWVKVKYDCFYNREPNPHEGEPCADFIGECDDTLTGWLRWKEGNTMLIDILLML